jgi:hypothetical protein
LYRARPLRSRGSSLSGPKTAGRVYSWFSNSRRRRWPELRVRSALV